MAEAFFAAIISSRQLFEAKQPGWVDVSSSTHFEFYCPYGRLRIRRRTNYPTTFAYIKDTTLVCGYGSDTMADYLLQAPLADIPEDVFQDDEFLYLAIDYKTMTITIQTDAFNTVSVFVGVQDNACIVGNQFTDVFRDLDPRQCTLDMLCVAQALLAQVTHERTFVRNIQVLYDRKRFFWSATKGALVAFPPDAKMKDYHHNRDGDARQFPAILEQTLLRYWRKYVGNERGGCELSGGVDSAVVAGYLADQQYQPITVTSLFVGNHRATQAQKWQDFTERFHVDPITTPSTHSLNYPWMNVLRGEVSLPFYHYQAYPYRNFFNDMYDELERRGSPVVFTGIGGDELFEHVDHRHVLDNTTITSGRLLAVPGFRPLANFVAHEAPKQRRERRLPVPLMSYSALTTTTGNDYYLQHNIWAAHPLADPRLYAYMQTIPLHYCIDKLLLRVYAQARRVPKSIYLPTVNENFSEVEVGVFRRLADIIAYALKTSVLAQSGLIETAPLQELFQRTAQGNVEDQAMMSLLFQSILYTELNIRSLMTSMHTFSK